MAVLSGDRETAQQIWKEAWERGNAALVAELLCAQLQVDHMMEKEGQ